MSVSTALIGFMGPSLQTFSEGCSVSAAQFFAVLAVVMVCMLGGTVEKIREWLNEGDEL